MQQLEWQKQGKEIIPVSINLSRASLYFDSVVSRYQQIADEIGVKTHLVPIEITESAAIDNDNIKGLADKFHDNGFPLLVDDFGSGYSSLATLNMKCSVGNDCWNIRFYLQRNLDCALRQKVLREKNRWISSNR